MRPILYLLLCTIFSCSDDVTLHYHCVENRDGVVTEEFTKSDYYTADKRGVIAYESQLNYNSTIIRNWKLSPSKGRIGEELEFSFNGINYISRILDKKVIRINSREYELVKYNIDQILSQDEESNKFFVKEFGVIMETFWKKSFIQIVDLDHKSNTTLKFLIDEIIEDQDFMWNQSNIGNGK